MKNQREQWIGFLTLLEKEIMRFSKVSGQTVFGPLVNAGLYLLVFGVSFSSMLKMHENFSYLEFLLPGLVALSALNNAIQNSASSIMVSKFHGDLQDLRVVPLSWTSITAAYVLACVARGIIVAVLVFFLGEIFSWVQSGHGIELRHPVYFLGFLTLSCAIFGNLGIMCGLMAKTFDQINAFTNFVIVPLIYLGGVFFSMSILHPFWQKVALFNPVVYAINGIRWSVLDISDIPALQSFVVLSVFTLLTSVVAWLSVKHGSYSRF